jgi:hypothetical protein
MHLFNGVTCGSLQNMARHKPHLSNQDQHAMFQFSVQWAVNQQKFIGRCRLWTAMIVTKTTIK